MVRAVLERALDAPEATPLPAPLAPPRSSQWRRMLAAAAVLLALLGVPGAGVVAWHFRIIDLGVLGDWDGLRADSAEARERKLLGGAADPPMEEVVVPPAVFDAQVDEPAGAAPARDEPVRVARKRRPRRVAAPESRPVEPAPAPAAVPAAPAPVPAPAPARVIVPANLPPEDLLAAANDYRTRRQWDAAELYYDAVVTRFRSSDAAAIAGVASAALHLQHLGDARGALAGYQRALRERPSGPLAEEARWGVAEAQRALGNREAEATALRDFLALHPQSALVPAAERRLARLTR